MAVVDAAGSGDEALISGTLQVDDGCVLLGEGGESVLLVWPSGSTTWDASTAAVSLTTSDGQRVALQDGGTVTFSGGGSSVAESGVSAEDFVEATDWIQAPSTDCVTDTR